MAKKAGVAKRNWWTHPKNVLIVVCAIVCAIGAGYTIYDGVFHEPNLELEIKVPRIVPDTPSTVEWMVATSEVNLSSELPEILINVINSGSEEAQHVYVYFECGDNGMIASVWPEKWLAFPENLGAKKCEMMIPLVLPNHSVQLSITLNSIWNENTSFGLLVVYGSDKGEGGREYLKINYTISV